VSSFLEEALSLGGFTVTDYPMIDTHGIICGAITSLLETKKIPDDSISANVKLKLGRSLYSFSGRIPTKIEGKFSQ